MLKSLAKALFSKRSGAAGELVIFITCRHKFVMLRIGTVKWGDIEQPYSFHGNWLNSVYNSHVTWCLWSKIAHWRSLSPTPKFLKSPLSNFDLLFLPKRQFWNENIWCLETKLWSKVIFSQWIQEYAEISVSFLHVTDCYCSGKRHSNKIFLTTKFPFVQTCPILMGQLWTTLVVFIWQKCTHAHTQWTGCFHIQRREAVAV